MGLDDKIGAAAQDLKGKAKEKIGDATDNESLQAEGVKDQAVGQTKKAAEAVKDDLK